MTLDFVQENFHIGQASPDLSPQFVFYKRDFRLGGGTNIDYKDVVISGIGSLTLVNAKANGLNYLKLYGKCEQNGTPTPSVPIDIVCNNGVIKVRHQSGLPLGYQPYEYLTANGNKWLNTGVQLASTDIVETEFKNSSSSGYGALYGVFALGDSSAFYANGTYYGYDVTNDKVNTGISVDTEWHTLRQDFGNGVITFDDNDTTYTPFEFENTRDNYLFARYYNNNYGYGFKGSCKRYKVIRNGELICDLIPVVQLSDNAVGMYDLVNNVFRGNLGTGTFDIANPINDLEIYYDGTVETVQVVKNYLSREGETTGQIINSDGTVSNNSNYCISAIVKLPAGNYACMWNQGSGSARPFSVYKCNSNGDIITNADGGRLFYNQSGIGSDNFTVETETTARICYRYTISRDSVVLLDIGTATAQPLLSVGNYKDEQNVTSGAVTRNVGVKVLDGTEDWSKISKQNAYYMSMDEMLYCNPIEAGLSNQFAGAGVGTADMPDNSVKLSYTTNPNHGTILFKHNATTTLEDWVQFVKDQYDLGNPIIALYPLATPTTESVTGQPLTIQAGTNIVEITQASINNLELEVSYKAGVEVTVEEIEAVNNDESVEVTING